MTKLLSTLLWTAVFCALLLAIDQVFVHVPLKGVPVLAEAGNFYLDFRGRLLHLGQSPAPALSVETVIEGDVGGPPASPPTAPVAASVPTPAARPPVQATVATVEGGAPSGYFYADQAGELHFVDRLDQVPTAFRPEAQALGK